MRVQPPFLLILLFSGAAFAQPVTFGRDDFASAAAPRAIAAADFNRDGWMDIATAGTGRDSVTILINRGRAGSGFRAAAEVVVGGGPFEIATGDLNRHGIPDLAIANADLNAVTILIGNGNGTFRPQQNVGVPGNPRGIAIADVNADARPDILVSQFAAASWRVLYGDGAGRVARFVMVASGSAPQGIVAADLDHDGRVEVVVAHAGPNAVAAFHRSGTDTWTRRSLGGTTGHNVLTTGDFDRNGWLDVAAASTSRGVVSIYLGGAAGIRSAGTLATGPSPRDIAAGDINQDGILDLTTGNRTSSTVSVFLGRSAVAGAFASAMEVTAGRGARAVDLADFNRDGRTDIAAANEFDNSITVLTNATSLVAAANVFTVSYPTGEAPECSSNRALDFADFDHSGRFDVAYHGTDQVAVSLDGVRSVAIAANASDLAAADVNRDGHGDILISDFSSRLLVFLGDGRGNFAPLPPVMLFDRLTFPELLIGDVNRDARPDVLLAWSSHVRVLLGRGDGTFQAGTEVTFAEDVNGVALGDMNRDGRIDLVVGHNRTENVSVLAGNGAGGWSGAASSHRLDIAVLYIALGDVNEDGRLDIVAGGTRTASAEGAIAILPTVVGGSFGASRVMPGGVGPFAFNVSSLDLGDIDRNGHLDIVTNRADILFGRGDATFDLEGFDLPQRVENASAEDLGDPRIADYNRDGLPDVITGTGCFGVMLNERNDRNRPPTVDVGSDLTFEYVNQPVDNVLRAAAADPDLHELLFEWRAADGTVFCRGPRCDLLRPPGKYVFTLTVDDGRGGRVSDDIVVTIEPTREIVLYASSFSAAGAWRAVADSTAADGQRMHHPNVGAAKLTAALTDPVNYIEYTFRADPTQAYRLWIRGKAELNRGANDSVFVQFTGATDTNGTPVYAIGTTSAVVMNLEECAGCGLADWGWEDDGWGAVNLNGTLFRFPVEFHDLVTIRIQTREDGLSLDQVVLSSSQYVASRPGTAKRDTTILARTQ